MHAIDMLDDDPIFLILLPHGISCPLINNICLYSTTKPTFCTVVCVFPPSTVGVMNCIVGPKFRL